MLRVFCIVDNEILIKKYFITYLLTIGYSFLELCFIVKRASIYELAVIIIGKNDNIKRNWKNFPYKV